MPDRPQVLADAELAAESVAQRCSTGTKRDGSPKAPTRHAIIWQAACLGAIEYSKLTKRDGQAGDQGAEVERLQKLVDAYRLAAVNAGWNARMADAYGHKQYLHDRIVEIDAGVERTLASGYDAAAYLRDGLAKVAK